MARERTLVEVPVHGGNLTVARWPGAGTPILLVHGITASHLAWARVATAPALAGRAIIAPDLRGRGGSSGLPGPYGLERHVEDLVALLDARGIERVCLAGHSMGAYIGVHFATMAPERLSSLVLVDGGIALPRPPAVDPDAQLEKLLGPAIARLAREFESVAAYREFWRAHPAMQDAEAWNAEVEAYVDYDLTGTPPHLKSRVNAQAVFADGRGPMAPAMVTLIDQVRVPTRIVTAARGLMNQPDPLMPRAAVEAKCAANPALSWRELADTNHYSITLGSGAAPLAEEIAAFDAAHS